LESITNIFSFGKEYTLFEPVEIFGGILGTDDCAIYIIGLIPTGIVEGNIKGEVETAINSTAKYFGTPEQGSVP
jgi:hypothetical protein